MKDKLSQAYSMLQLLDVKPTEHNIVILSTVLSNMKEVYEELSRENDEKDHIE